MAELVGKCFYCNQPVFASKYQLITMMVKTTNGIEEEFATHKKCRKKNSLTK